MRVRERGGDARALRDDEGRLTAPVNLTGCIGGSGALGGRAVQRARSNSWSHKCLPSLETLQRGNRELSENNTVTSADCRGSML